jgi:hypothetical protein
MSDRAVPAQLTSIALLGAWLGAAILVAADVAPAAFAVLPTRTLAGALVGRVLPPLFWSGMIVGVVVALLERFAPPSMWRTAAALVLVASCAAAQLVIAPRLEAIRVHVAVPIAALDASDPRRQAFGRLHGLSVAWMGGGMLAALVTLVLLARAVVRRS